MMRKRAALSVWRLHLLLVGSIIALGAPNPPSKLFVAPQQGLQNGRLDYDESIQGHTAVIKAKPIQGDAFQVHTSRVSGSDLAAGSSLGISKSLSSSPGAEIGRLQQPESAGGRTVTVDMQHVRTVEGLSYTPSPDAEVQAPHVIHTSFDGITWGQPVAKGTWAANKQPKSVVFAARTARYVRLTFVSAATSEGGTAAPPNYGSEVTVLEAPKPVLDRGPWKMSADSYQPPPQSFRVEEAIDGAITTWWQTDPNGAGYPHHYTMDIGSPALVAGLSYLPPPPSDTTKKTSAGTIGNYTVENSSDGQRWTVTASGTFPDNSSVKVVNFAAPVNAQYWRLTGLSEAGNRVKFAGAAEINLLDGSSQAFLNFGVSADSEELAAGNHSAVMALDSRADTFWQSASSGSDYPHRFTIDMNVTRSVSGLTYVPRQDGVKDGRIGRFQVEISTDSGSWTTVASGTFPDKPEAKPLDFGGPKQGRYVRITALSEADGRVRFASAAEFVLEFSAGRVPAALGVGQWGPVISFPIVPVAIALLPTRKLLAWSAYLYNDYLFSPSQSTLTATYDLATGQVSQRTVSETHHDMFCPGLALDFGGDVMVTGGNTAPAFSIFDPYNKTWARGKNMTVGRGYQTMTTMSDGRLFVIGGSWSGGFGGKNGEVYDAATKEWTSLPGCNVEPMLTKDRQGIYRQDNHGWLIAWRNGSVFQAGPSTAMNWYLTSNKGSVHPGGQRLDSPDSMNGNAVLFDAAEGLVFTAGGAPDYTDSQAHASAHVVRLSAPGETATVEQLPDMHYARAFHHSIVLPDGTILVVGGQSYAMIFTDDQAILTPELFDPATKRFKKLAPMRVPRTYHSTAVLLPDATVFTGGGGLCGACPGNHLDGQIYSPPYLFDADGSPAARPRIHLFDGAHVAVGGVLPARADQPIQAWSLIRHGSDTHSINSDQRRVALEERDGQLRLPADPGVVLPGYWLLFAVNRNGVPSEAKTVKVVPATLAADVIELHAPPPRQQPAALDDSVAPVLGHGGPAASLAAQDDSGASTAAEDPGMLVVDPS